MQHSTCMSELLSLCNSMPSQDLRVLVSPNRKRHLLTLTSCMVLIYKNVHLMKNVLAVTVFLLGLSSASPK